MILNLFGLLVVIYNLFLIDTISQLFANKTEKRKVYYDLLYYHNKFNTFFNHFIIGIAFPAIVLLSIMKWYFAIPLYFILTQIIFKISTFIFDKNINYFKVIILWPKTLRLLAIILFALFIYKKFY